MTTNRPGSRTILRAAFRTLQTHPRLMWFPIISVLGSIAAAAIGTSIAWIAVKVAIDPTVDLGVWSVLADPPGDGEGVMRRGTFTSGLVTVFLLQLWSLISSVGLSAATMEAMAGRTWSCRGSVQAAIRRIPAIATVAIAEAGVGRLLGRGKGRKRRGFIARITTSFLEMAWWAATYLVVPVLAREGRGGLGSIRRSAKLFRKTWKEAFVGRLALGWVWGLLVATVAVPIAACVWLQVQNGTVLALAIGIPVVGVLFGAVVLRTLDTIYRTALYVFATEGVVPEPFDAPELHAAFHVSDR